MEGLGILIGVIFGLLSFGVFTQTVAGGAVVTISITILLAVLMWARCDTPKCCCLKR